MALFSSKKKDTSATPTNKVVKVDTKKTKPVKTEKSVAVIENNSFRSFGSRSAIIRPRVTEKSGMLSQSGVYTFEVLKNANKATVAHAIKDLYKVTPVKVALFNNPAKNVFIRGRKGTVSGIRKALVTLKKGDKIDFV